MYLFSNAAKNLFRNKGRNALIALTTLAIIASTAAALTINNASDKIIQDTRLSIGSKVDISLDLMAMYGSGENLASINISDYLSYADSEYLTKSIFSVEIPMYSPSVFAVGDDSKGQMEWQGQDGSMVKAATLMMIGDSDPESLSDFGTNRNIIDGKMHSALGECIISSDLAELNNISVGDKISVNNYYSETQIYELTVTGIFSDATDEYPNPMYEMQGLYVYNQRNQILTSYETVMSKGYETDEGLDFKAEYYLKDPDFLPMFEKETRAKGLPPQYSVSINQEELDGVTGPLRGMRHAATAFMTAILALGGIVLALLSFIAVRERKYEVGVLRAMGLEKFKIAVGMLAETAIITAICLIAGLGAGAVMSQPVADKILSSQVAAAEAAKPSAGSGKYLMAGGKTQTSGVNTYTPISEVKVALDQSAMSKIALLALTLGILSGAIGIAAITRYEPLKILRELN